MLYHPFLSFTLSTRKNIGVNRIDLISPEPNTQIAQMEVKRESPEIVDNTPSKYKNGMKLQNHFIFSGNNYTSY